MALAQDKDFFLGARICVKYRFALSLVEFSNGLATARTLQPRTTEHKTRFHISSLEWGKEKKNSFVLMAVLVKNAITKVFLKKLL